jgi:hypothetical protein
VNTGVCSVLTGADIGAISFSRAEGCPFCGLISGRNPIIAIQCAVGIRSASSVSTKPKPGFDRAEVTASVSEIRLCREQLGQICFPTTTLAPTVLGATPA